MALPELKYYRVSSFGKLHKVSELKLRLPIQKWTEKLDAVDREVGYV